MTYQQTLDFLYHSLPMFSRQGAAAYKKDLTNTLALCEALGNPQHQLRYVHVAGTNGKGSVSHMTAAVLQQAGYKTGLYTSPHLKDFRERIKINGACCPPEYVVAFVERIRPLIETIQPSFFEMTVAMALCYFVEEKIDIAVIEVGLGGRLDSTNVILPEVSVITQIGMDHMQLLGDTIEAIAREKAGIIKPAVPAVIGETQPATKPVFEQVAKEKNAPLFFAQQHFFINELKWVQQHLEVEVHDSRHDETMTYSLDLPGVYQAKNLVTVLETLYQLRQKGWTFEKEQVLAALRQTRKLNGLRGRWEVLHQSPKMVADVAHNPDGIRQLLSQLEHELYNNLHIVIGMVKDKDIDQVLKLLPDTARYYFTEATIPRALPARDLQELAKAHNLKGRVYRNVNSAIDQALQQADRTDLVLVCGSVFLIGEIDRLVI